jgi:hypothetical protein
MILANINGKPFLPKQVRSKKQSPYSLASIYQFHPAALLQFRLSFFFDGKEYWAPPVEEVVYKKNELLFRMPPLDMVAGGIFQGISLRDMKGLFIKHRTFNLELIPTDTIKLTYSVKAEEV